jgi:hypothetical protein
MRLAGADEPTQLVGDLELLTLSGSVAVTARTCT